jgi:hypothetical protein
MRTLQQLALEGKSRFPLGASFITSNIYVDDIFADADALSRDVRKKQELSELLKSAGIGIDKWASNHSAMLPQSTACNTDNTLKIIEDEPVVKTVFIGIRTRCLQIQRTGLAVINRIDDETYDFIEHRALVRSARLVVPGYTY